MTLPSPATTSGAPSAMADSMLTARGPVSTSVGASATAPASAASRSVAAMRAMGSPT